MKLNPVHKNCIWCGRRLISAAMLVDCREPFGPRPRSDEHIIPESVFGKIITTDVCRCCNQQFGSVYDHALVKDRLIVEGAKRVGLKETDLWKSFEATQVSKRGRVIKIGYRNGTFKPKASLSSLDELSVPIINGKLDEQDLKHFRSRLIEKVARKKASLPAQEIRVRVDALIEKMRSDITQKHHDPILEETVEPTPLDSQLTYTRETKPWEAQWCLAKIIFELSQVLWPRQYRLYHGAFFAHWKTFIQKQEYSSDGKTGPGIFVSETLPDHLASRVHTFEAVISPTQLYWRLVFFGTACWKLDLKGLEPIYAPKGPGYRFCIRNPFGESAPDADVQVAELDS